jgi:hypothetical protein
VLQSIIHSGSYSILSKTTSPSVEREPSVSIQWKDVSSVLFDSVRYHPLSEKEALMKKQVTIPISVAVR